VFKSSRLDYRGSKLINLRVQTLDRARFKAAFEVFPMFFRETGWMPLAGTSHSSLDDMRIH